MSSQILFLYEWSERDVPIKDVLNGRESWATLLNGKDASATSFSKILLWLEDKSLSFFPAARPEVDERNRIERGKAMELASTFIDSHSIMSDSQDQSIALILNPIEQAIKLGFMPLDH